MMREWIRQNPVQTGLIVAGVAFFIASGYFYSQIETGDSWGKTDWNEIYSVWSALLGAGCVVSPFILKRWC